MPKKKKPEKRALSPGERVAIDKADFTPKQKAFVSIALWAGLRRGEILALNKSDIDFENRIIKVNKTLIFKKESPPEIKGPPKTDAGVRDIPVRQKLYDVLIEYVNLIDTDTLFTMNNGDLVTLSSYTKFWQSILKAIDKAAEAEGLPVDTQTMTAYILRHTFATDLVYSGVDVKTAQRLLGHSSVQTTLNIYTHCQATNKDIIGKMDSYNAPQYSTI